MRQQYTANEIFMGQDKLWSIFLTLSSLINMLFLTVLSSQKKMSNIFYQAGKTLYRIICQN